MDGFEVVYMQKFCTDIFGISRLAFKNFLLQFQHLLGKQGRTYANEQYS